VSSAAAKVILFGEHAVVYGQPAIAMPISSLRAYAEVESTNTPFQIIAQDLNNKIITFEGDDPLSQVVRLALEAMNVPTPDVSIVVRSDIPIASGLGSGAAISTAIIRCLLEYFDVVIPREAINEIVYEVEKIHHGTPSGIDNTVIVYEQAIYYVRDNPIEMIGIQNQVQLVVADTGTTALTKPAVADVRRLYEKEENIKQVIEDIGTIASDAKQAMQSGNNDLLGNLMLKNHEFLQKLTVSSDELDRLVDAAMSAGAKGAKLSGGGRGGNMIALVDNNSSENVIEVLKSAGAKRVFETTLEKTS